MSLQELVMSLDYYELLNVTTDCDNNKIKLAYENAILTYSPQNVDSQNTFSPDESKLILKMIEEAYAVLSNNHLKKIYDHLNESGIASDDQLSLEALTHIYTLELESRKKLEKPQYSVNEEFEAKFKGLTEWPGSALKECREYKNMSLEYLNYRTKINSWYIQAVEEMNLANLPANVFIRGYVIQLAKELGLNEKVVADSYMSLLSKQKNGSK